MNKEETCTIQTQPIELNTHCNKCKREMPDECIYYKHPKYGIVCEYCPEFNDGPLTIIDDE